MRVLVVLLGAALFSLPTGAALAQSAAGQTEGVVPAPASAAVVINLIRLLVQEGVLTQAKADALIREAENEAEMAARNRPPRLAEATKPQPQPQPAGPPIPPTVRVTYVPEIVKKQITDEVKQDVLNEAKAEKWAEPNALPEWTKRFHPFGDFRLRYEWDGFDPRNSPNFLNFQAINSGSPVDISTPTSVGELPFLDTTEDRERLRLRARLGTTVDITEGFTAGFRLATGNTTNPVSTNQTLGTDLNKDNFLLDLAYLKYQPKPWASVWLGRMENPWFYTDLVWSTELAFDGVAATVAPPITDKVIPFVTAGAFPIENTSFDFPGTTSNEAASHDKWLYGVQTGVDWKPHPDYDVKFGVAFYDFDNIQGLESSPCNAFASNIPCDTDLTRPGSLQQGNTLFAIRNTSLVTSTNGQTPPNFQYFGLASPFRELNGTVRFDYSKFDPLHLILDGDFVTNLAINGNNINAKGPVNNQGPSPGVDSSGNTIPGAWAGGGNGFMARFTVGHPQINERWDWNASIAYKYLESDAVVDAFTDSDFHLGGTNAKGYILGGNLGVAHNIYLAARWLSATEIAGPPYSVDVVQFDINGHF